ncbi:hypothetical protein DFH06DRAFT_175969 [Mycena polygramma]|nr:hypothetical protein DFH06DRAFT_175969 [Mycena polygramma]
MLKQDTASTDRLLFWCAAAVYSDVIRSSTASLAILFLCAPGPPPALQAQEVSFFRAGRAACRAYLKTCSTAFGLGSYGADGPTAWKGTACDAVPAAARGEGACVGDCRRAPPLHAPCTASLPPFPPFLAIRFLCTPGPPCQPRLERKNNG